PRQLPCRLDGAPLCGRRAGRDRALERHPGGAPAAAARSRRPAAQSARRLRHRPRLVKGVVLMCAIPAGLAAGLLLASLAPLASARPAQPPPQLAAANLAARVGPRDVAWVGAMPIYGWSEGALYQVYASPGRVTDII